MIRLKSGLLVADRLGALLQFAARRSRRSRRAFMREAHQIYVNGNGTASGDNGLIGILQRFVSDDLHCHLFTAPSAAVTNTTTLAGLTEVAAAGYAAATVLAAAFSLVGLTANNGSVQAAPISFGTNTSGGSVSVYGWYWTDTANTVLLAVANYDAAPIVVPNLATFPIVSPIFGDFSQYLS